MTVFSSTRQAKLPIYSIVLVQGSCIVPASDLDQFRFAFSSSQPIFQFIILKNFRNLHIFQSMLQFFSLEEHIPQFVFLKNAY